MENTETLQNSDTSSEQIPENNKKESPKYTRKIEIPIYEPKNVMPKISDLFNTEKRDELLAEIESQDIPEEVKVFLRSAAERHTQFNFAKIADFYAHANSDIKKLFENSALVIIDYDDAIKNGFIAYQEEVDKDVQKLIDNAW